jgi:3-hydroxy-9,10-secoandrosta-1,3,5(10)-triene-9,17-dione monooxygenase
MPATRACCILDVMQHVASSPVIPVPEPDLTAEEMVERAAAMREALREEAPAAETRGGYSEQMHRTFTEAGFYRILQPRRFGGYEFGFDTFLRVVIEISRGDPATGWALCLAAGHGFQIASFFSEPAQAELFGPDGHFVAPNRGIPRGTATPVEGGWKVTARWDYASGVTHATHMMGVTMAEDPAGNGRPAPIMVVLPREDITVLDDWGGDATIGLAATGSNTVQADDVFVPAHLALPYDWKDFDIPPEGTPGYRLHGNPMYLGRALTFFYGELNATQVGAGRAALDEYAELMHTKATSFPPPMARSESPDFQRWYGEASSLVDTAELALIAAAQRYLEKGRRWAEHGEPFTPRDDARLRDVMAQAGKLAWQAVDLMFTTAGTSAARRGSRLQRYFRDTAMFRTHIAAQYDVVAGSTGRVLLGQPLTH